MSRAFLIVLDSLGVGGAPDAEAFGDTGADTLGHIAASCSLSMPHLERWGLGAAAHASTGHWPKGLQRRDGFTAAYGCASEVSVGKDTPSGHWEMTGLPVDFAWGMFPPGPPSFPEDLIEALVREADLPGVLGNVAQSGTTIVEQLGDEHVASGKPIVYTSADSVFQIAAHEASFGLERLYAVCDVARRLVDPLNVGRVIARPFLGSSGGYTRTRNRRDWTTPPHGPTLLDHVAEAGQEVVAIGKIADIFAQRGVTQVVKAGSNDEVFDAVVNSVRDAPAGALVFANLVDFDMLYGHRRDVTGYAAALEALDRRWPQLESELQADDLVVVTADHGNDPTFRGTDHTRERIPVLAHGSHLNAGSLGVRDTFADIGQSIASHLGVTPLAHGTAFDTASTRGP